MRRSIAAVTLAGCVVLCAPWAEARDIGRPHRYLPGTLDGALVQVDNPIDGTVWAAWAYRSGAEYDVAVAVSLGDGVWSEPRLLGRGDGFDQVQPALAVDAAGTVYLVYADRPSGAILLTARMLGQGDWTTPVAVTRPLQRGEAPALRVVGDQLIVAFRSGRQIDIRALPLMRPPVAGTTGINEGPDPNASGGGDDEEDSKDENDPIIPLGLPGNSSNDEEL